MFEEIQKVLSMNLLNVLFTGLVVVISANIVLKIVDKAISKMMNVDQTLIKFIRRLAKLGIYFIAFLTVANALGINTSSIVALASVFSAAIALSAQNALSNLFGGVTLIINRPFKIGNYITTSGIEGTVKEIGLLNTTLETPDGKKISLPNGSISTSTIMNYSAGDTRRIEIKVTAAYKHTTEEVKNALFKAIKLTDNINDTPPFVRLSNYLDSSIEYTIRVWTNTELYWDVYYDLMENIRVAFTEDHIEMTYNHLIVHKDGE